MKLLYVSPVIPMRTGNGLAMRAGMVLESLAAQHQVSLLVKPLYPPHIPVPEYFQQLCKRVATDAAAYFWKRFDIVHVFRIASLPIAEPFLKRGFLNRHTRHHLDLDDIESETHRRLASLARSNGDLAMAAGEERWAARSEAAESAVFDRFERIYVCSELDRSKLYSRTKAQICIVPNAVRIPSDVPARPLNGPMLFVGTLGYYPNEDACRYLRREIVPLVSDQEFWIIGTGATDRLAEMLAHPAIRLVGEVPDLAPWYHQASAVVVPVRGGGGTRIKILEAFSFRRPVISTTAGLEGIDARHEEHVLVANTPEEFAQACRRLRQEPDLGDRLAEQAFKLLMNRYDDAAARKTIAELPWN